MVAEETGREKEATNEQDEALQGYYTKAMNIFRTLQIDRKRVVVAALTG